MDIFLFFKKHLLRKLLFAALFLGFYYFLQFFHSGFGGGLFSKPIAIEDVTQKIIITLSKNQSQSSSQKLSIRVSGELSGMAVINQLYDGDKKTSYVIGPGKVHLKITGDWPYPKCSLVYEPQSVASGQLGITYRFD